MDKVKLPRNIAIDIERFRDIGCENVDILYTFASGKDKENQSFADYAADNFDTLLYALVNGYEVDETPEDKVRELFDGKRPDGFDLGDVLAYRKGIMDTLKALNIKVVGVNHE